MTTPDFSAWLGRTESTEDNLDIGHVRKVALAIGETAPAAGGALPALWQWAFFVEGVPYAEIGEDGHPRRGGFLPPIEGRNRMWAGGRVHFHQPLRVGTPAQRKSEIIAVKEKEGRTGKLLFVTVNHQYVQDGVVCINEEQDIVYREPSPPKLTGSTEPPEAQWSESVTPDAVMLFRYSAVTYNGHRIHYDYPYVTEVEGYPGLVVHGPLLATRMCSAFQKAHPEKRLQSMSYRGLRPLTSPRPFQAAGRLESNEKAQLWVEQDGTLAHQAELIFSV